MNHREWWGEADPALLKSKYEEKSFHRSTLSTISNRTSIVHTVVRETPCKTLAWPRLVRPAETSPPPNNFGSKQWNAIAETIGMEAPQGVRRAENLGSGHTRVGEVETMEICLIRVSRWKH